MQEYDQLKNDYTHYWCSVYALLNLFRYDYWIYVELDYILKFLVYLESISARFKLEWAYASVVFPACIKYINLKLGLKLKLGKSTLKAELSNKHGRILGYKRANTFYTSLFKDWEITMEDVEDVKESKENGHFHFWKRWKIIESLWGTRYKMNAKVLDYAYFCWLYYPTIRYVYWEEELQKECLDIVKYRKMQKLNNPYVRYEQIKQIKQQLQYKNKD